MVLVLTVVFCAKVLHDPIYYAIYDEGHYLSLAGAFTEVDGPGLFSNFTLAHYPSNIRGYVFPFILHIIQLLGGGAAFGDIPYTAFKIYIAINCAMLSCLITILLPRMFGVKLSGIFGIVRNLFLSLLLFIFWRGFLYDALTDFWAVFFVFVAVTFLRQALRPPFALPSFLYMLAAGICSYAAYNIRTIYLFSVIALVIVCCFFSLRKGEKGLRRIEFRKLTVCLLALVIGFCLVGVPQGIINENKTGNFDIMVQNRGLFAQQLIWGLSYTRYETYTGHDGYEPEYYREPELEDPQINYVNDIGEKLQAIEPSDDNVKAGTIGYFVKVCVKHPFDVCAIYWSHFINLITATRGTSYIANFRSIEPLILIILSILLWLIWLLSVIQQKNNRKNNGKNNENAQNWLFWVIPTISVLAILPGAIEQRFGVPLYLLLYSYLCYKADYAGIRAYFKKYKLTIIIGGAVLFAFWFTQMAQTVWQADLTLS